MTFGTEIFTHTFQSSARHTYIIWIMFASLIGFYQPPPSSSLTTPTKPLSRQFYIMYYVVRPIYPIVQFIWIAYSLPIAYQVIPSPFFPPPYFMQQFLIDTEILYKEHVMGVVCSLFLAYWTGTLLMNGIYFGSHFLLEGSGTRKRKVT